MEPQSAVPAEPRTPWFSPDEGGPGRLCLGAVAPAQDRGAGFVAGTGHPRNIAGKDVTRNHGVERCGTG
jgi:hypothetical protein